MVPQRAVLATIIAIVAGWSSGATASLIGDAVDYSVRFGLTASGTGIVAGDGVEEVIGPFLLDFGDPSGAQGQVAIDWMDSGILLTFEKTSGRNGQISGTEWTFSSLDWVGQAGFFLAAEPILTASGAIFPSIVSYGPHEFTMNIGSFTFFQTRTIQIDLVAVPEPDSVGLLGVGIVGVGVLRRRRMAAAAQPPPLH